MWKEPSLVWPPGVDICSRPIVAIVAINQLPGACWCNGSRPHGETKCAQRCCYGGLIKHEAYEFHASAAFVAFEHVDSESAFEKLCPGDAFSFARFLLFVRGTCQWWIRILTIGPMFDINKWSWFVW